MATARHKIAAATAVLILMTAAGSVAYWFGTNASDTSMASPHQSPSSLAAAQTGYSDCGVEPPEPRPQSMTMTCADGGEVVNQIDWRIWDSTIAMGTGTVTANNCDPSCADGLNIDYPATVLMDTVETNGSGPQFTRTVIIYGDRTPNYTARKVDLFALLPYSANR